MGMTVYMLRNKETGLYWRQNSIWVAIEKGRVWTSKRGPVGAKASMNKFRHDANAWRVHKGQPPHKPVETEIVEFNMMEK